MTFSFRKAAHVARQEVWTIVFTKGFIIMLIVPLVLLIVVSGLIPMVEHLVRESKKNRTVSVRVGVVGGDPVLIEEWRTKLQNNKLPNGIPMFQFVPLPVIGQSQEQLLKTAQNQVRSKKLDTVISITGDLATDGKCELYFMRGFNFELPRDLSRTLTRVIRDHRMLAAGYKPDEISALMRGIDWNEYEIAAEPVKQGDSGKKKRASFDKLFVPAFCAVMVMFFLVFTTSQRMLRGIVEEKTSRVVEILLSSVSPTELLAGKVFGFFLIGMIQFFVWAGVGLVVLMYREIPVSDFVQPVYFLQFFIFLSTGYLFYAAVFASIGAMVSDETESQGLQGIVTMFIVLPLMLNIVIITQPMWLPIRLLSFVPFLSPTLMAIRMVVTQVPWWEITAVALSSIFFSIAGTILAARIFRVGILLTGKRPSPRELWRWCFYKDVSGVIEA